MGRAALGHLPTWLAVWVLLAACSAQPADPSSGLPEATPLIGQEEVEPLPEYQIALELDARQRQLDGEQLVTYPNRTGAGLDEIVFRLYPNLPQYGGRMEIGPVLVDGQRSNWSLRAEDTSLV
ncbi:MAG: hypothetical protein PVJ26_20500, partial [Anaerolineae bacterium]